MGCTCEQDCQQLSWCDIPKPTCHFPGCGVEGDTGTSLGIRVPSMQVPVAGSRAGGCVLQVAVCCEINPVTAIDWRWETALPLAGKVSHCLSRFCQMAVKPETCKGCGTATGHLGRQGTCSSWLLLGQKSSLWLVRHQTAPGRVLFDGRTCRNSVPCGCFPVAPRARGGLSSPSVVG